MQTYGILTGYIYILSYSNIFHYEFYIMPSPSYVWNHILISVTVIPWRWHSTYITLGQPLSKNIILNWTSQDGLFTEQWSPYYYGYLTLLQSDLPMTVQISFKTLRFLWLRGLRQPSHKLCIPHIVSVRPCMWHKTWMYWLMALMDISPSQFNQTYHHVRCINFFGGWVWVLGVGVGLWGVGGVGVMGCS